MFDLYSLRLEKRTHLEVLGSDDRTKFIYKSDLSNKYTRNDAGNFFEDYFLAESPSSDFNNQNIKFIDSIFLEEAITLVEKIYNSLFPNSKLSDKNILFKTIGIHSLMQAKILSENKNNDIIEFGPGLGFTAIMYKHFYDTKNVCNKYYLVEAIEALLCIQQRVLSAYCLINNNASYKISNINLNNKFPFEFIHTYAWDILSINISNYSIFSAVFFECISEKDYDYYFDFIRKCVIKGSTLTVWGGIERTGGGDAQYLFGFGSFINRNIINTLNDISTFTISKYGSELLVKTSYDTENILSNNIFLETEKKLLVEILNLNCRLVIDDNNHFLTDYEDLFNKNHIRSAYSLSVSTAPFPCNLLRKKYSDISNVTNIIILSNRWRGILNRIKNDFKVQSIYKISDKIIHVEVN